MKISFILPCYNTELYLSECIDSLYKQGLNLNEFEVICVNNATEDNSEDIINKYITKYSNIKYVKLSINKFSGGAYNEGLRVATGTYVMFVDSDDYIKNLSIKNIITKMDNGNIDVCYFNISPFTGANVFSYDAKFIHNSNFISNIGPFSGSDFIAAFTANQNFQEFPVPAYRKLIRRSVLITKHLCFTCSTIGTDYLHNIQLLLVSKRVLAITDCIYCYRYNSLGVTKTQINTSKILFALTNYTEAYKTITNSRINNSLVNLIILDIIDTINPYIKKILFVSRQDSKEIISIIDSLPDIKKISRGTLNKLIVNYPQIYLLLIYLLRPIIEIVKIIKS